MAPPRTQYVRSGDVQLAYQVFGEGGARVAALAEPGEVLVTRTLRDLVAGSGIVFAERGEHELKGVPDRWTLYAAMA